MNLIPLGTRLIIKPEASKEKTQASGLVVFESAIKGPSMATVVAVGPGRKDDKTGEMIVPFCKVGDRVAYTITSVVDLTYDNEKYYVVEEANLIGVMR